MSAPVGLSALGILVALGSAAHAGIITNRTATADTEVRGPYNYWADDNNYGGAPDIYSSLDGNRRVLFRFDIADVEADVTSASFKFFNNDANINFTIYRGTQDWTEMQATWNSASTGVPWTAGGGSADTSLSVITPSYPAQTYVNVDVTSLVQAAKSAGQNYLSLVMYNNVNTQARVWAKENGGYQAELRRPTISVISVPVPEPAAFLTLAGGAATLLCRRRR